MIRITAREAAPGRWQACDLAGNAIGHASRTPFLNAARALLQDGADPGELLMMVDADDPGRIRLQARLGTAASMTVHDEPRPHFAAWKAQDALAGT